jgi:DNA-directed RNA polymerase subunit RPC12/RpoP
MEIEQTIDCPSCGGKAGLVTLPPGDQLVAPGTVLTYRCPDCGERIDVVEEGE